MGRYFALSNAEFVQRLLTVAGIQQVTTAEGQMHTAEQLAQQLDAGRGRAEIVRLVVESREVEQREYNGAFVAMQYFGYLRRDPGEKGYNDWLNYLNNNPGDYRTMVWAVSRTPV